VNEKDNNGDYPLLSACRNNNSEMIKLIIDYANENKIKLKINEKNNNGLYPPFCEQYY